MEMITSANRQRQIVRSTCLFDYSDFGVAIDLDGMCVSQQEHHVTECNKQLTDLST
jgi:hypothetical protein